MSRFQADRLHLGIEPDRLTLVRLRGAFRSTIVGSQTRELRAEHFAAAFSEVLADELKTGRWLGTRAHVVLSDRLVRYFVARNPPGTRSVSELRQAALAQFDEIYGDETLEWEVQRDLSPFATSALACACRKSLSAKLVDVLSQQRLPLASLVPFSVALFNRHRRRIGRAPVWLAVVGRAHLSLSYRCAGDFIASGVHALHADAASELPRLIEQERLRLALAERPADPAAAILCSGHLVSAGDRQQLVAQKVHLLDAPVWPGQDEAWSQAYRFALAEEWPACA